MYLRSAERCVREALLKRRLDWNTAGLSNARFSLFRVLISDLYISFFFIISFSLKNTWKWYEKLFRKQIIFVWLINEPLTVHLTYDNQKFFLPSVPTPCIQKINFPKEFTSLISTLTAVWIYNIPWWSFHSLFAAWNKRGVKTPKEMPVFVYKNPLLDPGREG